jgi:mono/diheme cytochrome c family protein
MTFTGLTVVIKAATVLYLKIIFKLKTQEISKMKSKHILALIATTAAFVALPALAQDVSYRKDIAPLIKKQCAECHGADAPTYKEFTLSKEAQDKFTKEKTGPRTDTYELLVHIIAYPGTGSFMRRLDDGTHPLAAGKPGNMYKYLGDNDAERAQNLKLVKAWVGDGAWYLNRFKARGDVPGVTKEQLDKLKLDY